LKKLNKALKAMAQIIKNPWLLNHILEDNASWESHLKKRYGMENGLPQLELTELFPGFNQTINNISFLDGSSLPTDIALLKALAQKFDDCSYFEIGTWRGESVVNVADNAAECLTLNLSREEILELGYSEKYADLHGFFSKGKPNITHLEGNSMAYDFAALGKKFDLIFIDGAHQYEFVENDTKKVFEHLVHENTIVVWHDYAYNPEKVRNEVLAGILDGLPPSYKKDLYHVSNTLCAIYIKGNFKTKTLNAPSIPAKSFTIELKADTLDQSKS